MHLSSFRKTDICCMQRQTSFASVDPMSCECLRSMANVNIALRTPCVDDVFHYELWWFDVLWNLDGDDDFLFNLFSSRFFIAWDCYLRTYSRNFIGVLVLTKCRKKKHLPRIRPDPVYRTRIFAKIDPSHLTHRLQQEPPRGIHVMLHVE